MPPRGPVEEAIVDYVRRSLSRDRHFSVRCRQLKSHYKLSILSSAKGPIGVDVGLVATITVGHHLTMFRTESGLRAVPVVVPDSKRVVALSDPDSMDALDDFLATLSSAPSEAMVARFKRSLEARQPASKTTGGRSPTPTPTQHPDSKPTDQMPEWDGGSPLVKLLCAIAAFYAVYKLLSW